MSTHQMPRQRVPASEAIPAGEAIPDRVGVGFKAQHAEEVLGAPPELGWLEVHPENYMVPGGPRHALLEAARERYPLSLHGVALSLGGAERQAVMRSIGAVGST